jgi:hypothetical protein
VSEPIPFPQNRAARRQQRKKQPRELRRPAHVPPPRMEILRSFFVDSPMPPAEQLNWLLMCAFSVASEFLTTSEQLRVFEENCLMMREEVEEFGADHRPEGELCDSAELDGILTMTKRH